MALCDDNQPRAFSGRLNDVSFLFPPPMAVFRPLASLQDLRKQVAPLLKSFQGEVRLHVHFVPWATCCTQ
jgi:hypothetical protein